MERIEKNLAKAKELLVKYENAKHIWEYLNIYEKLSLYSVFLWENLSQLKTEYNRSYYRRKIAISHSFLTNRQEKISEKTCLEMANDENSELLEQEMESEAIANRLDIFLRQINKVLEAIRTRISYEKAEKWRITSEDL